MMKKEKFEEIIAGYHKREQALLQSKATDYAAEEDRLLNFNQVAELLDCSPEYVACVFWLKHVQSIMNIVRKGISPDVWCYVKEDGSEGLKQKLLDARNYIPLIHACIEQSQPLPPPGAEEAKEDGVLGQGATD